MASTTTRQTPRPTVSQHPRHPRSSATAAAGRLGVDPAPRQRRADVPAAAVRDLAVRRQPHLRDRTSASRQPSPPARLHAGWFVKLVALALIWAYLHHFIAGVRHLWMDADAQRRRAVQGRASALITLVAEHAADAGARRQAVRLLSEARMTSIELRIQAPRRRRALRPARLARQRVTAAADGAVHAGAARAGAVRRPDRLRQAGPASSRRSG